MSDRKHTPGPWEVNGDTVESKAAHGLCVAVCSEEGTDVDGHIYVIDPYEALANACLIAAAPDLLEALKGALLMLNFYSGTLFIDHRYAETVKAALAAIAKAEGK